MNDNVKALPRKKTAQRFCVAYVRLQEIELANATDFCEVRSLPRGRIKVVETVHDREFHAPAKQSLCNV
jgi:hypothetical protein